MELFIAVLVLLVLIGLSNILNRFVPFIPVPLIQIVLGVSIALLPAGVHLPLNPELFLCSLSRHCYTTMANEHQGMNCGI